LVGFIDIFEGVSPEPANFHVMFGLMETIKSRIAEKNTIVDQKDSVVIGGVKPKNGKGNLVGILKSIKRILVFKDFFVHFWPGKLMAIGMSQAMIVCEER